MMLRFDALKALDGSGYVQRSDAQSPSVFVEQELRAIIAENYDRLYPMLDALEKFPAFVRVPAWAMAWGFESMEHRGAAKWAGADASDIPRADIGRQITNSPIRTAICGYGYSLEEVEAARGAGVPLERGRAEACRRAQAEFEHDQVLFGSTAHGIPGVLSDPKIPLMTAPTGNWLATATTADQIIEDTNRIVNRIYEQSNRTHGRSVRLLLPPSCRVKLSSMRIPDTQMTVEQFVVQNNPRLEAIEDLAELETAGPGSAKRALAYERDAMVLSSVVAMPYQELSPEVRGFATLVPSRQRLGGCFTFRPLGAVFADGI